MDLPGVLLRHDVVEIRRSVLCPDDTKDGRPDVHPGREARAGRVITFDLDADAADARSDCVIPVDFPALAQEGVVGFDIV